jgi:hypothetical protein
MGDKAFGAGCGLARTKPEALDEDGRPSGSEAPYVHGRAIARTISTDSPPSDLSMDSPDLSFSPPSYLDYP